MSHPTTSSKFTSPRIAEGLTAARQVGVFAVLVVGVIAARYALFIHGV